MNEARDGVTTVGARLRAAREAQGQTLDDVGRATRVPVRHLVQIEDGRLEGLPAAPYSAGFVKSYARVVGLDPVMLSQAFRAEFDEAQRGSKSVAYERCEPADPSRLPPRPLALVALAIAILLIGGYAVWRGGALTGDGPDDRARLAANGDKRATPVAREAASVAPAPTRRGPPRTGGDVVLTATSPTWVKITERNGPVLFQGMIARGKSYGVPPTAIDPVIRTGKPDGLTVSVGGRSAGPLDDVAHTIANVSLKGDALAARSTLTAAPGRAEDASIPTVSPAAPPTDDVPRAFANGLG